MILFRVEDEGRVEEGRFSTEANAYLWIEKEAALYSEQVRPVGIVFCAGGYELWTDSPRDYKNRRVARYEMEEL